MSGGSVDAVWHRRHDIFNLLYIPLIVLGTVTFLYKEYMNASLEIVFQLQWWCFAIYLVVDTLWLMVLPQSVASPTIIIAHHIVSMLGWMQPFFEPDMRIWTASALLVEVNTFFLIGRRNWPPSIALDIGFIISWIVFRLGVYPYIVVAFWNRFSDKIYPPQVNVFSISYMCLLLLVTMNVKWSIDLFKKSKSFFKGLSAQSEKGL